MTPEARVLLAMVGTTVASNFHRAAVGVVAPELASDLGMGPETLGAANTAFFGALLVAQIPVGIALDRVGPRRLVAALTVLAVLAAVAQALARSPAEFLTARFLLGLGCGASFMGAVVLSARWHRGPALTRAIARVFAFSQFGILAAGAPLALAAGALGWRGAFLVSAALTALLGLLWWRFASDGPGGAAQPIRRETLREALAGQLSVWGTPGLPPILALHAVGYAAMATLLALWAGPYLADRHGLDGAARGAALLAMGLATPAGQLLVPPAERALGRRAAVLAGAGCTTACLILLAAWPDPPLAAALVLLTGVCLFSAYPMLLVAQGRALFPDHLAGRGVTTVNLAQVLGSALLPMAMGAAVAAAPAEAGFRLGFALLAASVAAGALVYARGRRAA